MPTGGRSAHQLLEVPEPVVEVGPALQGRQDRQPGAWAGGRRALPEAGAQGDGFLAARPEVDPAAGDVLDERQSLQRVEDGHRVAPLPGRGQHEGVAAGAHLVVAEVQCGVPEVAQQVQVRSVTRSASAVSTASCRSASAVGPFPAEVGAGAQQQLLEAPRRAESRRRRPSVSTTESLQSRAAVDAVAERHRGGHRHLEGALLVVRRDPLDRPDEDPVGVLAEPTLTGDACPQPVQVGEQERVRRPSRAADEQTAGPRCLAGGPGVAGRCDPSPCRRGAVRRQLGAHARRRPPRRGSRPDSPRGRLRRRGPPTRSSSASSAARGPVPGGAVDVVGARQRIRQRTVGLAPLGDGRGLVERRPHQGVPQRDDTVVLDHQQPGPLRLVQVGR